LNFVWKVGRIQLSAELLDGKVLIGGSGKMTSRARLEGKRALITGAGAGLGAQMARRFHQEGADVLVNDLDLEKAEKVAKEVDGAARWLRDSLIRT
jgi:glutamyl-tRNA reductase